MDVISLNRQQKVVLFVSSSNDVSDFLYDFFSNEKRMRRDYFVEGTATTRESAIRITRAKRPDLIILFEKTKGDIPLSELMYRLRLYGSRVIFITSRRPGDRLLEVLVGYGIYDIITDDTIESRTLYSYITQPREFQDVSIFHRLVVIDDNSTKESGFRLPNIQEALMNSNTMYQDYLQNPYSKIQLEESVIGGPESLKSTLYKSKENIEKKRRRVKKRPKPKAREVDDIDVDFTQLT